MECVRSTLVEMRAVVVGFDAAAGFFGVGVEGIEMGADLLDGSEILANILSQYKMRTAESRCTCVKAAPVSRSLSLMWTGSPRALLVTGIESICTGGL